MKRRQFLKLVGIAAVSPLGMPKETKGIPADEFDGSIQAKAIGPGEGQISRKWVFCGPPKWAELGNVLREAAIDNVIKDNWHISQKQIVPDIPNGDTHLRSFWAWAILHEITVLFDMSKWQEVEDLRLRIGDILGVWHLITIDPELEALRKRLLGMTDRITKAGARL